MEINVPASANMKFIRVHTDGQSVCMDPSGNNCGDDGAMNPCSSIYCTNGGVCDPTTAQCTCPSGFSGAACEKGKKNSRARNNFFLVEVKKESTIWTDSKGNYSLKVDVAPCDQPKGNFSVRFEAIESMDYVTFMYQFASKCDAMHCDCSTPVTATATDATKKVTCSLLIPKNRSTLRLFPVLESQRKICTSIVCTKRQAGKQDNNILWTPFLTSL
jgi:hypothetical protein